MIQSTITRFFKKEVDCTAYIKEEVDINWDEADNCYGEAVNDVQKKEYIPKVVLEKLSDSVLQKYSPSTNASPVSAYPRSPKKCSTCKKLFKNKISLRTHSIFCGKERNLQCSHCSYKTNRKQVLAVHLSKRHPEGNFAESSGNTKAKIKFSKTCQKCKKTSDLLGSNKCEQCSGKLLYQCNKCAKQFESHSLAYYHWDTRCGVKGYFNCTKCDFKSVWRPKVLCHMKRMHSTSELSQKYENIQWIGINHSIKVNLESNLYQCPKCSKSMENSPALIRHTRLCGGSDHDKHADMGFKDDKDFNQNNQSEPNKCSVCGEEFEHIYSLNKHSRFCQKIPPVTRITGDNNIQVVELNEDILCTSSTPVDKRNAKIKKMVVKYCRKCQEETSLGRRWCIDRELSCHKCKSTLLYKCKKCLKEYPKYRGIERHINNVCNSQEEFKCTECNYTACNALYVRSHYRLVHANSNVECQKCRRKFKNVYYLKKHMLRCGVEKTFQCEHCPFKSKLKLNLGQHIFRTHMEPVVIDKRERIKMSQQRFSRAKIHLKAHCSVCKREQRLTARLKHCQICERTLCYKCKTCKNNYAGDDDNACNHVKCYLDTIKFECKRCGRGAISERSLWMHENKCGVETTFRCRFCKFDSKWKSNTVKHEKIKHPHKI